MLSSQYIDMLRSMSDKEIIEMAASEGFELSEREVRKLRPYLNQFSFSWLFLGIPNEVAQQIEYVLGRKRSRQLLALFSK